MERLFHPFSRGQVRPSQQCRRVRGYTATRRPVMLICSQWFERITDAIAAERQVKGWSHAKKEALMRGDFSSLQVLSRRKVLKSVG
jgi:predicted GIY-YIG superfamily endonuclease